MNKPDKKTLRLWLDGELEGDKKRELDSWAEENAAELDSEFKCDIGWDALSDDCMATLPSSLEPPYPEFFNHKILNAIQEEEAAEVQLLDNLVLENSGSASLWQKLRWMIAPAAVAAVAAFYAGTTISSKNSVATDTVAIGKSGISSSSVYLPNSGIVAAVSESNYATEIVLSGLTPVSDELEIAMIYAPEDDSVLVDLGAEDMPDYMLTKSVQSAIYYY